MPMTVVNVQYLNKGCTFRHHLKFKRLNNKLKSINRCMGFVSLCTFARQNLQCVIASAGVQGGELDADSAILELIISSS